MATNICMEFTIIALHFNPQPPPFILTKYRYPIQLHNLSVHIAI